MMIDETLADIKNGSHACTLFYDAHKDSNAIHQLLVTSNLSDLCISGFYIENRGEVTLAE